MKLIIRNKDNLLLGGGGGGTGWAALNPLTGVGVGFDAVELLSLLLLRFLNLFCNAEFKSNPPAIGFGAGAARAPPLLTVDIWCEEPNEACVVDEPFSIYK